MRRVMAVWIISSNVLVACPQNWPEWLWWENGMSDDDETDDGCIRVAIGEVGNVYRGLRSTTPADADNNCQ